MTDKVFLDTNIIVYSFDKNSSGKDKKAQQLLDQFFNNTEFVISTQVIQEFCSVALNKMNPPLKENEVKEFISTFSEKQIEIIKLETIDKALSIKEKFKLSFWDSLIVATALLGGCNKLYTEDMQHGMVIDSLEIMNPFV